MQVVAPAKVEAYVPPNNIGHGLMNTLYKACPNNILVLDKASMLHIGLKRQEIVKQLENVCGSIQVVKIRRDISWCYL